MKTSDPNIDGGWAWLVIGVIYLGIIIVSTAVYMNGVLYVALLEHFHEDAAKTSLVSALNSGLLCLLGPLASVVMVTYSCRVCMFMGAAIAATSSVASAYVHTIDMLILTYGVIGGIGNALTCTTFVVVLGYYFEKRRNLVIAISQAALGVGFFLASPFALAALDAFGIHGTFVFLGSAHAQICIIAMICKPSSIEQRIMGNNRPSHELEIVNIKEIKSEDETKQLIYEKKTEKEISKVLWDKRISDRINELKQVESQNGVSLHHSADIIYDMKKHKTVGEALLNESNGLKASEVANVTTSCIDISRTGKPSGAMDSILFLSNGHLSNIAASNGFLNELFTNEKVYNGFSQTYANSSWICRFLTRVCNIRLFKNLSFLLFLISAMTWNFTLSICAMHLPNYMVLQGSSDFDVAAVMTCLSFCNFAGRFIGALTVARGGLDSLTLHVGMLGVAGIMTVLFPLYAGSIGVYIFAASVGLYTGGPNSIMTPISLQMVGMEYLSSAHGLERFFCGLGYFAGPPVAGCLYSLSGSYKSSFLCAGTVVLFGSFVAMVAALKRKQTDVIVANTNKQSL